MKTMILGSLFDGIGGFPLAGTMAGMQPVWASEIEPFPIRVTQKRFPQMRHYGDVHTLRGNALEPVDVITFGSPCQNLSIAGKRTGLAGDQSSLFFEAVRIIREMRESTDGRYPRWAVWENVPGALSSNAGQDFRQVLESLVHIKEPEADVPMPPEDRWYAAGEIMGDGYSLAWRILDAAKGWGVAQRRKRIFAVVDLDGACAGKVLFESEGMSGYTPPGGEARQGTAGSVEAGAGEAEPSELREESPILYSAGFCTEHSATSRSIGYEQERSPTLRSEAKPAVAIQYNPTGNQGKSNDKQNEFIPQVYGISPDQSKGMLSDNPHAGIYEAKTSRTLDCGGGNPCCNQGGMVVVEPCYCVTTGSFTQVDCEMTSLIMARDWKSPPVIGKNASYAMNRAAFSQGENAQFRIALDEETAPTITAAGPGAIAEPRTDYLVRRLTPGECCRLQGYPDGWCEVLESENPDENEITIWQEIFEEFRVAIRKMSRPKSRNQIVKWLQSPGTDAAIYKAYGNSVAVPCVFFVLAGIVWASQADAEEGEGSGGRCGD